MFLEWLRSRPYPPTIREVATRWDVAPSTAHERLKAMRDRGVVRYEDDLPRTLRPVND